MSTSSKAPGNLTFAIIIAVFIFVLSLLIKGCNAIVDFIDDIMVDDIETQTQKIVDFEKTLYDIEQTTKTISAELEDQIKNVRKPSLKTVREAQNTFELVSNKYDDLKIPGGLSDEREEILKKSKNYFRDAYKMKSSAMFWLERYILYGKAEYLVRYKEAIDLANYDLVKGVTLIVDLENELGVDLSQTMYKGKVN